jgi:hypothetical protein
MKNKNRFMYYFLSKFKFFALLDFFFLLSTRNLGSISLAHYLAEYLAVCRGRRRHVARVNKSLLISIAFFLYHALYLYHTFYLCHIFYLNPLSSFNTIFTFNTLFSFNTLLSNTYTPCRHYLDLLFGNHYRTIVEVHMNPLIPLSKL